MPDSRYPAWWAWIAEGAVDVDLAELQFLDGTHHRLVVAAEYVRRQPVAGVIRQIESFVEGTDRQHGSDRPERFLAHDDHLRPHAGEDR